MAAPHSSPTLFKDRAGAHSAGRRRCEGVKATKSSDSDRLDNAAVHCVAKWHYRPAIKDNQTIDTPMTVKADWNLKDEKGKGGEPNTGGEGADYNTSAKK